MKAVFRKLSVLAFAGALSGCSTLTAFPGSRHANLITPDTELHPAKMALLVIDTQNDFANPKGSHPMPDLKAVVPQIEEVIKKFRRAGKMIVHVVRLYQADGSDADRSVRWAIRHKGLRLVVPDTWGSQLLQETNPTTARLDARALMEGRVQRLTENEFACYKPRFNGFYDTSLHRFLRAHNIDSVVFVGITFPNCVRATQLGATDHDYRVAIVPSACTQVYPGGLEAMQGEGVQILTKTDLDRLLETGGKVRLTGKMPGAAGEEEPKRGQGTPLHPMCRAARD